MNEAIQRAQDKANKSGVTQYVGRRYDMRLYVSKVKPRGEWLVATCEPGAAR